MSTRVVSVWPALDANGQQKTYQGQNGTSYKFLYTLDNGMSGEVNHLSQQPKFPPGSEVEATVTTKDQRFPTLKLEKPGGFQRPGGPQGGGGAKSGWSPEKEAKIEASGLVQAAIASGASTLEQIEQKVALGMQAVASIAPRILAKRQAAAPAVTNDPQPQYQPPQAPYPMPSQAMHTPAPGYQVQVPPQQHVAHQAQTNVAPALRQPLPQNPNGGQVWQGQPAGAQVHESDDLPF